MVYISSTKPAEGYKENLYKLKKKKKKQSKNHND